MSQITELSEIQAAILRFRIQFRNERNDAPDRWQITNHFEGRFSERDVLFNTALLTVNGFIDFYVTDAGYEALARYEAAHDGT